MAFEHTKAVMGGQVTVAFYDTSTLYFESQEDEVRVPGYSKDGKLKSITIKGKRHVISMSDSRAKKDAKDREKGIQRLEKRFESFWLRVSIK